MAKAEPEFQFAHVETYARKPAARAKDGEKHSVKDILGEAMRVPENSPHVAAPREPELVEGMHPAELLARHDELVASRRIAGKRNKVDVHTLAAAVYSWPELVEYTDRERFWQFVLDVLEFHRKHIGPIDSAIVHWDETYPHLHIYTSSMDARGLTPGWRAKREVLDAGGKAKDANAAYKEAMRGWQDAFYLEVGQLNGLDRLGPKRQRLTRREHRDGKLERQAAGDRLRAVRERAAAEARLADQQAAQRQAEDERLAALKSQADAEELRLRQLRAGADGAEGRLAEARRDAERAEARLAELRDRAKQLSADLDELPKLRAADDRATVLDGALRWIDYLGEKPEVRRVWDAVAAMRGGEPAAVERARAVMAELRVELEERKRAAEAELHDFGFDGPSM